VKNIEPVTLGSLFDGIGAVPLAASYFGIKTLWASEILPNAISVTRRHFPVMEHLGDITKLDGGKISPVHIIVFGSPCQSFSVAGPRTSFAGKSGLFFEAIRIIREMRSATDGRYPEIVLFENVPGLLSVDSRRSYKTVLEAFTEGEIPMPQSGRWANAGMVRGRRIDLAWIIKDASKHFRVPQRRRRLFLICDFAGQRAGEILFVTESLSGYFTARTSEGQGTPADAAGGAGSAGFNGYRSVTGSIEYAEEQAPCINVTMPSNIVSVFMAGQARNARSIAYSETLSPTLKASPSGLNQIPCVCEPKIARTLTARGDSSPCADRGQNIVAFSQNQRNEVRDLGEFAGCLAAEPGMKQQTYVIHPPVTGTLCASGAGMSRPAGMANETDLCVAVDCRHLNESEISGTLQSKNEGGYSLNYQNPVRTGYIVRRLTPTECERLMSLPDGWTEYGHDGRRISDSARYQLLGNSIVVNVLAYIMQNISEQLKNSREANSNA